MRWQVIPAHDRRPSAQGRDRQYPAVANAGVSAAKQATMTLDALGPKRSTKPLYDYLEHPSTYRASEFAAMFQRAAANQ
jgi:hypothetical protein